MISIDFLLLCETCKLHEADFFGKASRPALD